MNNNKYIKKSEGTITGIVITLLLVIGIFSAMFLFLNEQASKGNVILDSKYNDTFTRLDSAQNTLDDDINDIQNNIDDIKEADSTYQVAWNGLKGLGNIVTLPISFVGVGVDVTQAIAISTDVVPTRQRNLIIIGIIAVILFIILANLKGESRT